MIKELMKKLNILIDENIPFEKKIFSGLGNVKTIHGRKIDNKAVMDFDVLIVRSITKVNEELLKGTSIKFVGTATVGIEHIDRHYLQKNNIGFADAKASNARSVFEYVITALFHYCSKNNLNIEKIVLGVVGVGNIGSLVADASEKIGIRVLRNDPPLKDKGIKMKFYELDELLKSDFITIHTPLIKTGKYSTFHLFNEKVLDKVNKNTVLINTARGSVVDNHYLINNLKKGNIQDAVLDVWENEPFINIDLLDLVFTGTPHIAGYSLDGKVNGAVMIYNEMCNYFNIDSEIKAGDILPVIENNILEVSCLSSYESTVYHLLKKVYNIEEDFMKLKNIKINKDVQKQGEMFDRLRMNYQTRREFSNYKVVLNNGCRFYERLKKDLPVFGFQIKEWGRF